MATRESVIDDITSGNVLILRGISGSGKSSLVKAIRNRFQHFDIRVYSADDALIKDEKYTFDQDLADEARKACLRSFSTDILNHSVNATTKSTIYIIDNVNANIEEIAPYHELAVAFGHEARVIQCNCEPSHAMIRNVHKVPPKVISEQFKRMEEGTKLIPAWWNISFLLS